MPDIIIQTNILYLIAVFFAIFIAREIVAFKKILPLKYVFTPLVTYTIIIIALYLSYTHGFSRYTNLIIAGLTFALIADTLLMIEEVSFFIHGLLFFLFAHICYIGALSSGYVFSRADFVCAIILCACFTGYYVLIHRAKGKLYLPVIVYMLVLLMVLLLSIGTFIKSYHPKGLLVMLAAILFAVSDGVLAFNQFVKKIPHSTVVTWSLYAPAQLLFAISCYY